MFNRFLVISVLMSVCTAVAAEDTGNPDHFQRMDVFELEWVSDPQISPDGDHVVYRRNAMDIMRDKADGRLWLINANGTDNQPLTGRDQSESGAAWSPDGTRVAFVSQGPLETDGAEIHLTWVATGKTARLTQLAQSPEQLTWSPDGTQLAFAMVVAEKPPVLVEPPAPPEGAEWAEAPRITDRLYYERDGSGYIEPGYRQFFVLSHLGGTPRQVTDGEFRHDGAARWTSDGKALVFSGNREEGWQHRYRDTEIYRVNLETLEVTALTNRNGPDANPVVSPDGDHIAWLGHEDRVQTYQLDQIHVMNSDGSNPRVIETGLDRNPSNLAWDDRGRGLYFLYDDQGDTRLGHVTLAGRFSKLADQVGGTTIGRPYGGGSFSVSSGGDIAFTHVTAYRPAELAILSNRSEPRIITQYSDDMPGRRTLGKVEEVRYTATTDGLDIQGWLIYPPDYDSNANYPLLVENHGGPISNYGARFSPELQLYASAGYIVFYPNPRGSTSYGEEFGNLLFHNYPGDDYQDVMDGVDALIERGIAHEDKLYVTGGSAGGIMTAWIIGKNHRFEAAAVIKPVMNWVSKTLTADNYFMYANYRYPGQPWENLETYMKFSPVSLVGNIETPTLVMVGNEDLRTPLSEAKQLYSALKIRDIETALVELPGASHNIAGTPSQLIAKVDHILAWFEMVASR